MWIIFGIFQGISKDLDSCDTMLEARKLVAEYREAYGPRWKIDFKKGTSSEV